MYPFEFKYSPFSRNQEDIVVAMTGTDFGSVRPDAKDFGSKLGDIRHALNLPPDSGILAQQLGQNTQITDLLQSAREGVTDVLINWPKDIEAKDGDDSTVIQPDKIPNFLRTAEKTDGVILPGENFRDLAQELNPEVSESIAAIREQIKAVQIYNADCPVITVTDKNNRVIGVLHGALECLFNGEEGDSILKNAITKFTEEYKIPPSEILLHVAGGAGPETFGYNQFESGSKLEKQLQALTEYDQATNALGNRHIITPPTDKVGFWGKLLRKIGLINDRVAYGPRKDGIAIDLYELVKRQALSLGVPQGNIKIDRTDTALAGREMDLFVSGKSKNEEGTYYSNVFKSNPNDTQRNAYTVVV